MCVEDTPTPSRQVVSQYRLVRLGIYVTRNNRIRSFDSVFFTPGELSPLRVGHRFRHGLGLNKI